MKPRNRYSFDKKERNASTVSAFISVGNFVGIYDVSFVTFFVAYDLKKN
jgi:hypothetical protein